MQLRMDAPELVTAKLSRYFCMKSKLGKLANVAVISDIFIRNFTNINLLGITRIKPVMGHRGFIVKLQNIYDFGKQLVGD